MGQQAELDDALALAEQLGVRRAADEHERRRRAHARVSVEQHADALVGGEVADVEDERLRRQALEQRSVEGLRHRGLADEVRHHLEREAVALQAAAQRDLGADGEKQVDRAALRAA